MFETADTLRVLARNELGERISATPAIVDDKLYLRTLNHLYAFGEGPPAQLKPWNFGPYDQVR